MKTWTVPVVFAGLLLTGCVTQAVSLSDLDDPGRKVSSEVSKFNILGLSPLPMEAVSTLLEELNEKCGATGVTGVSTRVSYTWAVIGQIEKVEATGYCRGG